MAKLYNEGALHSPSWKGEARLIRLEGDLDADQRARLMEIADKCPVHRTLEHGARVQTELVAVGSGS